MRDLLAFSFSYALAAFVFGIFVKASTSGITPKKEIEVYKCKVEYPALHPDHKMPPSGLTFNSHR